MLAFIVQFKPANSDHFKVSSECYRTFKEAEEFILSRSDKPVRLDTGFRWSSPSGLYIVNCLMFKN